MDLIVAALGVFVLAQVMDGRAALAIGVFGFTGYRLWRRRRVRKIMEQSGLTQDEFSLVQDDLRRDDDDSALHRIAAAQERHRLQFEAETGIDLRTIIPVIGRDVPWQDVVRHVFRVCEFERGDTTLGPKGEVRATDSAAPYGYLLVESPIINRKARLPIVHCDDFRLAASVFDEPKLLHLVTEAEFLVTYAPKHLLSKGLAGGHTHALHYVVTPRGTLDRYYALNDGIHMVKLAPERLFGPFVYDGMLRVQMNADPRL